MKKQILTLVFLQFFLTTFAQTKKDLNIDYMLRGQIYAQSSIIDSTAAGGFGRSNNSPKKIGEELQFSEKELFLKIDSTEVITIANKFNGYNFYIGNKSKNSVQLRASDSRLNVIAEVYYNNKWQPIEYLPTSWCGNSYHTVYLKQNEYWSFKIPKFSGKINVKLRYVLMYKEHRIYSNEILAIINKKQLTNRKEYNSVGLMDPYTN